MNTVCSAAEAITVRPKEGSAVPDSTGRVWAIQQHTPGVGVGDTQVGGESKGTNPTAKTSNTSVYNWKIKPKVVKAPIWGQCWLESQEG